MTLKTTKEQRDEWRKSWNCPSEFVPLLDDADRAGEMEKELAQCMEALTAARKGQPLGPVVGAQTIINQQREIADLRDQLEEQKALVARLIERAKQLLQTMEASEGPDAHFWVEGRWNSDASFHLRQVILDAKTKQGGSNG